MNTVETAREVLSTGTFAYINRCLWGTKKKRFPTLINRLCHFIHHGNAWSLDDAEYVWQYSYKETKKFNQWNPLDAAEKKDVDKHWVMKFDKIIFSSLFFSVSISFQAHGRVLIISSVILLLISHTVTCRPSTQKSNKLQSIGFQKAYDSNSEEDHRIEKCNLNMDLNELCQRCEKITESAAGDVFALCCSNEDGATDYCRNYVFYGVTWKHKTWLTQKIIYFCYFWNISKTNGKTVIWING